MKHELEQQIAAVVQKLFDIKLSIDLRRPDEQFGDYATNVALQLSQSVGKNPRDIGQILADQLQALLADTVADIKVEGPGFLNLRLRDQTLLSAIKPNITQSLKNQVIVAEYSDPNPFKPLHAGHLFTTLVGDTIARLLEVAGAGVVRINYGGDVGLHVGQSMWAILNFCGGENPDALLKIAAKERATWLGERYIEGNKAYEAGDEQSREAIIDINKRVYQLHDEDDHQSGFAQIYWTCRTWSYEYFKGLYEELAVHQFDRVIPESESAPLGLETVRQQLANGVYQESDGAVVFKGEAYGLHTRVFINSHGLPTYETKDVGLLLTKWQDYHFDRSIVITAHEQAQYMSVMLKSVEQFAPAPAQRSVHLTHGTVKLKGGIKMSSRKGNVVTALDILETATTANREATGQDNPATVLGAVKYAFLKNRIGGDIIYEPAESVKLEGNSGPYLQYAYARASSILRKAAETSVEAVLTPDLQPAERSLARKITEYSEVVDQAVSELLPHYICTYLYELAQIFNRFYEHNKVIGDERQTTRLALVEHYATTLQQGLSILGIASPEKM